ncbi:VWA domain-containing protein [Luteolibacter yonseiensis]|uniref:VWA domain-containing protein n=1 Tax=Luteolibacter yonseiensis TaxID=1144680 RepID=A0A934QZR9_9BACT|nr:VWA domain-containing protein [Luteolibacter yonseiensis]MBK1814079.1 VWA domain-containing protein [Luteolibacter yonseiensis]
MIHDFHFLRPAWFFALAPLALLLWGMRRSSDAGMPWRGIIADHLAPYLLQAGASEKRDGPWWLILCGWLVAVVVLAGPSWRREPSPFADDVAALAVVIRISPSMRTEDIAPDRLTRSVQKVHDLLSRRGGSKTALIAYAGSAHLVMPATTDAAIVESFAAALDPSIMPEEGDAAAEALAMASASLREAGGGSILWITDEVASGEIPAIQKWSGSTGHAVRLLAPLPDTRPLEAAASAADAEVVLLRPDDSDIDALERAAKFAPAVTGGGDTRWSDGGYLLVPLLLLLIQPFFRRGWMVPIAAKA